MTDWPATEAEALAVQDELRLRLLDGPVPADPARFAGVDVSYAGDRLAAAVVVLDAALRVVDRVVVKGRPAFGYVPGLFAFRELPAVLEAFERLTVRPDVVVCDGQGRARADPAADTLLPAAGDHANRRPPVSGRTAVTQCGPFGTPAPLVSRQDNQG
jgi:deoxyinosine 3'endonuclease (endonuclease V)